MQNSYICSQKFVEKERWMTMMALKRREGSGARSIRNWQTDRWTDRQDRPTCVRVESWSTPKKWAAFRVSRPNSTAELQWVCQQLFSLQVLDTFCGEKERLPLYRNCSKSMNTSYPTMPTGMTWAVAATASAWGDCCCCCVVVPVPGPPGPPGLASMTCALPQKIILKKGLRAAKTHLCAYTWRPSTANVTSLNACPFNNKLRKSSDSDLSGSSRFIELLSSPSFFLFFPFPLPPPPLQSDWRNKHHHPQQNLYQSVKRNANSPSLSLSLTQLAKNKKLANSEHKRNRHPQTTTRDYHPSPPHRQSSSLLLLVLLQKPIPPSPS